MTKRKQTTVYFDSELYRALRLKAAEMDQSLSDLVNDAVEISSVGWAGRFCEAQHYGK